MNRRYKMIRYSLLFLLVLMIVFAHAFSSANKTEKDRQLIKKIIDEMMFAKKKAAPFMPI